MEKLVFDVSGTTVKHALMTSDAKILEQGRHDTPDGDTDSFDEFLSVIAEAHRAYEGRVDGIAVALPGRIDTKRGTVITPGALKYNRGRRLADEIRARVADLPVAIVNDGKAAVEGELWRGNLAGCSCGVVMLLGSGVAGGIVMDGRVWEGAGSFAGEFSYVMERPGARSWEEHSWTNGSSIKALINYVSRRTNMSPRRLDGKKIFRLIEAGNEYALAGLRDMCDYIAYMVYDVSCILDPELVLLGGSIARQPLIMELVGAELDRLYGLVPDDELPRPRLGTCRLASEGSLVGALHALITHHPELA